MNDGATYWGSVASELSELDADCGTGCRSNSPALGLLKKRRRLINSRLWKRPTEKCIRDRLSRIAMFLSIVDSTCLEQVTSDFITPEEIGDCMPFDDSSHMY